MSLTTRVLPGLMLAAETFPDTFATAGNVTADVAVAAIVARGSGALQGAQLSVAGRAARGWAQRAAAHCTFALIQRRYANQR